MLHLVGAAANITDFVIGVNRQILTAEITAGNYSQSLGSGRQLADNLTDDPGGRYGNEDDGNKYRNANGSDVILLDSINGLSRNTHEYHADNLAIIGLDRIINAVILVAQNFGVVGIILAVGEYSLGYLSGALGTGSPAAVILLYSGSYTSIAPEEGNMVAGELAQTVNELSISINLDLTFVEDSVLYLPRTLVQSLGNFLCHGRVTGSLQPESRFKSFTGHHVADDRADGAGQNNEYRKGQYSFLLQFHDKSPHFNFRASASATEVPYSCVNSACSGTIYLKELLFLAAFSIYRSKTDIYP